MNNFKLFGFAILLLSAGSCSLNTTITKEEIKEDTKEYTIDVTESFIDSRNNDDYRIIEPVNTRMGEIIDSLIYDTKSDAINESTRRRRPSFKYQLVTKDTIFNTSRKIISTRITAYIFTGGAHGKTEYYAVNYTPEKGLFLKTGDLFDMSQVATINAAIAKYFVNPEKCFNVEPTIELASTINISETSAIFTYEHYVLGAYYCGDAVVEVPLDELKNCLKL